MSEITHIHTTNVRPLPPKNRSPDRGRPRGGRSPPCSSALICYGQCVTTIALAKIEFASETSRNREAEIRGEGEPIIPRGRDSEILAVRERHDFPSSSARNMIGHHMIGHQLVLAFSPALFGLCLGLRAVQDLSIQSLHLLALVRRKFDSFYHHHV